MKIYLLFYMCHFAMGLTHCYKTTVFLNIYNSNIQDNVYGAVIMAEPLREFIRVIHLMNVERRQAAADPRPSQTT